MIRAGQFLREASSPEEPLSSIDPSAPWVLVVAQDADLRQALADALRLEHYGVRLTENGEAALDCVLEHDLPSLVLLDPVMPRMNGNEFLHILRRTEEGRQVPVLLLSGALENCPLPDCLAVLPGPYDLDVLLKTVESALAGALRRSAGA